MQPMLAQPPLQIRYRLCVNLRFAEPFREPPAPRRSGRRSRILDHYQW
jgi:hypothetical protein